MFLARLQAEKSLDFQNNSGIIETIAKVTAAKTAAVAGLAEVAKNDFGAVVDGKIGNGGVA